MRGRLGRRGLTTRGSMTRGLTILVVVGVALLGAAPAGAKVRSVARTKITRPATAEPGSGAGTVPTPSGVPTSTPIEGEPPLLARPATAVTVGSVTLSWMPRDSWVRYVSSGVAANDGVVPGAGA